MNAHDGIVVGRLTNRFRATLWERGEAVLWAEGSLAEEAVAALLTRMTRSAAHIETTIEVANASKKAVPSNADARVVTVTQGSLDNSYINLFEFMDFFEQDSIGGGNKKTAAARQLTVEWDGQPGMETDIDGVKKFLRNRALVSKFMRDSGLTVGDRVEIRRLSPYRYRMSRLRPE